MTNNEIVTHAIEKAESNGFDRVYGKTPAYYRTVFSKSFAQYLWGEKKMEFKLETADGEEVMIIWPAWKGHRIKMIMSEDPVLYLTPFIDDYPKLSLDIRDENRL